MFEVDNNYLMERNRLNNDTNPPPAEGNQTLDVGYLGKFISSILLNLEI